MDVDPFSRPFHGLRRENCSRPSDESLGYCQPSANADWGPRQSCKAEPQSLGVNWNRKFNETRAWLSIEAVAVDPVLLNFIADDSFRGVE